MQKKLLNYQGLYGDHQPFLNADVHCELLQTRSALHNWDINEHLHTDLFQLFIVEQGEGILLSEHKKTAIYAPCVLLVPHNALHGFAFQSNISGIVFTFQKSFLENILNNTPHILLEINHLRPFFFENNPQDFETILWTKTRINEELSEAKPEQKMVLETLFRLIFFDLYRMGMVLSPQIIKSDNRTLDYFHSFQKLIRQSLHESKTVREYAQDLHITAVHLNRICRAVKQKSALQVIHDYQITEAKKYLLTTAYSIAEISYLLNFYDPAHFSKQFRKYTTMTPGAFRATMST
jgi:AraC family transcriptional activator of pobA